MNRSSTDKKYKLAILQTHPIQYFSPLYKRLAEEKNIELKVYYCSRQGLDEYADAGLGSKVKWDIPLLEGYDYQFLPDIFGKVHSRFSSGLIQPVIIREMLRNRYDVLWIYGYKHITYMLAILAAKLDKTTILIRTDDNTKLKRLQKRSIKNLLRKPILKYIYSLFDGALAIGSLNAEHHKSLGIPDNRVFLVPFAVDNAYFTANNKWDKREISKTKQELNIPLNLPIILFVGKLNLQKQPLVLLKGFQKMQARLNHPAALVYVGEGEQHSELQQYCIDHSIKNVIFTGFINQSEISKYYAMADIFVLPSQEEPWGLVVNEAMCARNAVIVSDAIGAATDLVFHSENGYIFPVGDINALIEALCRLVNDPILCHRMGKRSLEIISKWSFEEDIIGIQKALGQTRQMTNKDARNVS